MSGNKKRGSSYYFDACIYLSYLRNESDVYGKDKIRAIEAVWNESESGGAAIVTSSITITEVLSNKLGAKEEKKFLQAVHKIHQLEDVTPPIAERARQYRNFYHSHPVPYPPNQVDTKDIRSDLTTPDAIHLATAKIYGCEQFWTFDGYANVKKQKTIGLLWLGNKVGDDDLIITQPEITQGEFDI